MRSSISYAVIAALIVGLCAGAFAQEAPEEAAPAKAETPEEVGAPGTMESIQHWLDQTEEGIDSLDLWKFKVGLHWSEQFIYDDNIFLNDDDEAGTDGRVGSFVLETRLGASLLIPTNPDYSRFFKRDAVKVLGYEFGHTWYANDSGVTNIYHNISTDIFAFLKDLMEVTGEGSNFYFRLKDDLEFKTDPLDLELKNLSLIGFPTVDEFKKLERWENRFLAVAGYEGNLFRAELRYANEWYHFIDDEFEQADHFEHLVALRAGADLPNMEDKAVYVEGRYRWLIYDEDILNDADVIEAVVGFDGMIISRKLRALAEAGYASWDPDDNGKTADDEDYSGFIGLLRLVFRPWEERKVQFQLEMARELAWSAIANFRLINRGSFSVIYEVLPKQLELDLTLAVEDTDESEGPDRLLWEASIGARYHLFKQVDLTARYLYRTQDADDELEYFEGDELVLESNGDFFQNVLSVGFEIRF